MKWMKTKDGYEALIELWGYVSNVKGTGEGVSKWLSKVTRKLNGSKSNLTSTKRCKIKSVQLQVIVNIVTYSLFIIKWL